MIWRIESHVPISRLASDVRPWFSAIRRAGPCVGIWWLCWQSRYAHSIYIIITCVFVYIIWIPHYIYIYNIYVCMYICIYILWIPHTCNHNPPTDLQARQRLQRLGLTFGDKAGEARLDFEHDRFRNGLQMRERPKENAELRGLFQIWKFEGSMWVLSKERGLVGYIL